MNRRHFLNCLQGTTTFLFFPYLMKGDEQKMNTTPIVVDQEQDVSVPSKNNKESQNQIIV